MTQITKQYLAEFAQYLGFIEQQGYTYNLNGTIYTYSGKGLQQL